LALLVEPYEPALTRLPKNLLASNSAETRVIDGGKRRIFSAPANLASRLALRLPTACSSGRLSFGHASLGNGVYAMALPRYDIALRAYAFTLIVLSQSVAMCWGGGPQLGQQPAASILKCATSDVETIS